MKKIYTHQTIDRFFEEFKSLPSSYKMEQVHQLLNNPNAKATHKVNRYFKYLKLIIMTSIITVSLTALLLTLTNKEQPLNNEDVNQKTTVLTQEIRVSSESVKEVVPDNAIQIKLLKHCNKPKQLIEVQKDSSEAQVINETEKTLIFETRNDTTIQNPGWPIDTVLEGSKLFVTLTDKELISLGIQKIGETVYYCNMSNNGRIEFTRNIDSRQGKKILEDTTHYSFYPVFVCDANFENHSANDYFIKYNMMDTLLPVILQYRSLRLYSRNEIWWFTTNKELFDALPERYKYLETTYTELKKLKKDNRTYVNYFDLDKRTQKINSIVYLQLTDEQLINLGFEIFHDTVSVVNIRSDQYDSYRQLTINNPSFGKEQSDNALVEIKVIRLLNTYCNYCYKIEGENGNNSYGSGNSFSPLQDSEKPIPIFITDTLGRHRGRKSYAKLLSKQNIDLNTLIPIKIDLEKYGFAEMAEGKQELIFWYKPDANFFNRLPNQLSHDLEEEYSAITNETGKSQSSCTYFEVCKSTLPLENFRLYPNPAKYAATIEFDINDKDEGDISIYTIAGAKIKILVPNAILQPGHNTYQMDLSGITPGIYLISINSDNGFKTQRLMVSQ